MAVHRQTTDAFSLVGQRMLFFQRNSNVAEILAIPVDQASPNIAPWAGSNASNCGKDKGDGVLDRGQLERNGENPLVERPVSRFRSVLL
jgi:hypothetical protein